MKTKAPLCLYWSALLSSHYGHTLHAVAILVLSPMPNPHGSGTKPCLKLPRSRTHVYSMIGVDCSSMYILTRVR